MMNFMMMMTVMQTSRAKRIIKMLERLLKQDHLYSDDEIPFVHSRFAEKLFIASYIGATQNISRDEKSFDVISKKGR